MSPILLFALTGINKKHAAILAATIFVVVSMPVVAVFALGQKTLTYLSNTNSDADSTYAISTTTVGIYEGPEIAGDKYDWGNCTYWAYALRLKAGDPISNAWGNASSWAFNAQIDGYEIDHIPAPGSVMQISDVDGGLGHVAYVTAVNPSTGEWTISEMNVQGLDIVDLATYPASAAIGFNFIHDKET